MALGRQRAQQVTGRPRAAAAAGRRYRRCRPARRRRRCKNTPGGLPRRPVRRPRSPPAVGVELVVIPAAPRRRRPGVPALPRRTAAPRTAPAQSQPGAAAPAAPRCCRRCRTSASRCAGTRTPSATHLARPVSADLTSSTDLTWRKSTSPPSPAGATTRRPVASSVSSHSFTSAALSRQPEPIIGSRPGRGREGGEGRASPGSAPAW